MPASRESSLLQLGLSLGAPRTFATPTKSSGIRRSIQPDALEPAAVKAERPVSAYRQRLEAA
eukprot:CAMPEP_0174859306 /NCGR_PEP_ID=MMETSP1114-20130205/46019_1 /TAXON_ID=312471 /ORGANISM="Neobodo designis, Strain CCAP 1951/1" /LENGTH=61 /DNA_ID=CAMNT_0016094255 /DNA_START=39 /DNA_END=220 /DNA_ORIENTATION=+